jgi:hypothetical protein
MWHKKPGKGVENCHGRKNEQKKEGVSGISIPLKPKKYNT